MFPLLLLILGYALFYVTMLDIRFGKAVPLSLITLSFLLFLTNMITSLSAIKISAILFIVVLLPICILTVIVNKKKPETILKNYLCPSLVIFVLFFLYYYFVTRNRGLSYIDDFFRWAPKVKEAIATDKLYSLNHSDFAKPDKYPPFSTLLQLLFNLYIGGYSEGSSLFAVGVFGVSLLLIYTDRFNWDLKDLPGILTSPFLILALLLTVNSNAYMDEGLSFFNNTYVDWMMAVMLASGFLHILEFKGTLSDFIAFGVLNTALMLTDSISFSFSLILIATLLTVMYLKKQFRNFGWMHFLVWMILIPGAFYLLWRVYLYQYNPTAAFSISQSLPFVTVSENSRSLLKSALTSQRILNATDTQTGIFKSYLLALVTEPLYRHPFPLTYMMVIALVTASLLVTYYFHRKQVQILPIALFFVGGSLAYALAQGYGYAFVLKEYEGVRLAQFGRYLQTYTLPGLIIAVLTPLSLLKNHLWSPAGLLAAALFVEPASVKELTIQKEPYIYWEKEREILQEYLDLVYKNEKILVVYQNDQRNRYIIDYLFGDKSSNLYYYYIYKVDDYDYKRFINHAKASDYILIAGANDEFVQNIWTNITEYDCSNLGMYKVIVHEGKLYLEASYNFEFLIEENRTLADYLGLE